VKHSGKALLAALKMIGWIGAAMFAVMAAAFLGKIIGTFVLDYLTWVLLSMWVAFALFAFYFFRDPDPMVPTGSNLVISPGHGKVDAVDTTTEPDFMGGECQRISIFFVRD